MNSGARQACCWLSNWVKCVCALAVVVWRVVCRLCGQRGPLWTCIPPLNTFLEKFPAIISTTLQITEFYAVPQARSYIPKFSLVQRLWLVVQLEINTSLDLLQIRPWARLPQRDKELDLGWTSWMSAREFLSFLILSHHEGRPKGSHRQKQLDFSGQ